MRSGIRLGHCVRICTNRERSRPSSDVCMGTPGFQKKEEEEAEEEAPPILAASRQYLQLKLGPSMWWHGTASLKRGG